MVNWLTVWRRASYRGAQFWVDKDQVTTGRRLIVHQFPHRNTPYIEDMGREANKIQVTAYVASDSALKDAAALVKACDRGGAARLQLPDQSMKAHCESCERAWDKDKQGFIAFSLSFWRDGSSTGLMQVPYLQRLAFSAALAVPKAVGSLLKASVSTVGRPGFVRDLAAEAVRNIATDLDTTRASLALAPDKAPAVARAVQDIFDDAESLSTIGSIGDVFQADSFVARQIGYEDDAPPLAAELGDAVEAMREAATRPEDVVEAFVALTEAPPASTEIARTPSRRVALANAAALALSLRVIALSQWAVAVTEQTYTDRRAAIQARADVAERFDALLEALSGPAAYETYVALSVVRDATIQFLTRLLTDLAPIQIYEVNTSMPSLWWANRLYADATRAAELAQRNRVLHASFMPREVEALAPVDAG